jgi:hypothetical protein
VAGFKDFDRWAIEGFLTSDPRRLPAGSVSGWAAPRSASRRSSPATSRSSLIESSASLTRFPRSSRSVPRRMPARSPTNRAGPRRNEGPPITS